MLSILKWVEKYEKKPFKHTMYNAKNALSPTDYNVFLRHIAPLLPEKPIWAKIHCTTMHLWELKLPLNLFGQTVRIMDSNDHVITVKFRGERYNVLIDMIKMLN